MKPEEFVELKDEADEIGFSGVMSGPLVRSSYRAGRLYQQAIGQRGGDRGQRRRTLARDRPAVCDNDPPPVDTNRISRGIHAWPSKEKPARRPAEEAGPAEADRRQLPDDEEVRPADRPDPARCLPRGRGPSPSACSTLLPGSWILDARHRRHGRPARRADRLRPPRPEAAYAQIEGQPGAAAAALGMLQARLEGRPRASRSTATRTSCTAWSARPASCWSARATPTGSRRLLATERRKHERVASETPIHEVICGDPTSTPGAVPVRKLSRHVTKLGRNIKPAEMTDVLARLKALDANRSNIPIPKGPMPTNLKGARQNMRGR